MLGADARPTSTDLGDVTCVCCIIWMTRAWHGAGSQQQPQLEECKTDSGKTEGGASEGARSSGPIRAPPYSHVRSLSGGSSAGGEPTGYPACEAAIWSQNRPWACSSPLGASSADRKLKQCACCEAPAYSLHSTWTCCTIVDVPGGRLYPHQPASRCCCPCCSMPGPLST